MIRLKLGPLLCIQMYVNWTYICTIYTLCSFSKIYMNNLSYGLCTHTLKWRNSFYDAYQNKSDAYEGHCTARAMPLSSYCIHISGEMIFLDCFVLRQTRIPLCGLLTIHSSIVSQWDFLSTRAFLLLEDLMPKALLLKTKAIFWSHFNCFGFTSWFLHSV